MLSMPPETTIPAEPALMMSCASMVAFMPEPQTLLMVVAPVASGSLAPRAAWRAGAWPCPAGSTQPMITASIRSGDSLARSTAAPITWEPSLCALKGTRSPMNLPSGVRAAETMTTGSEAVAMAALLFQNQIALYDDLNLIWSLGRNARELPRWLEGTNKGFVPESGSSKPPRVVCFEPAETA